MVSKGSELNEIKCLSESIAAFMDSSASIQDVLVEILYQDEQVKLGSKKEQNVGKILELSKAKHNIQVLIDWVGSNLVPMKEAAHSVLNGIEDLEVKGDPIEDSKT